MNFIHHPQDPAVSREVLGGKASSLSFLTSKGFNVPNWICVTTKAFEAFIDPHRYVIEQVAEQLLSASDGEIEAIAAALQLRLSESVPTELIAQINASYELDHDRSFSVRSSGIQEDSSRHSFAGIFSTELNVARNDVPRRIIDCWLSAFSSRALRYLQGTDVSLADVKMAVVVQEMLQAEKSGVLFQANPNGGDYETIIVAGYGLGEGIVSGQVETDTLFVDRASGAVRSEIAVKSSRVDAYEGGGIGQNVICMNSSEPVLSENDVSKLLSLNDKLRLVFEEPQDVEWSFDRAGTLWLLQSRDITTIPKGKIHLFDNTNIVESYPGLAAPLTSSVVTSIYREMFYHMYRKGGCSRAALDRHAEAFNNLVTPVQGRMYYNLSYWYDMMAIYPLSKQLFVPALEDSLGVARSIIRSEPIEPLNRLIFGCGLTLKFFFYKAVFNRYRKRYNALLRETETALNSASSDRDLMAVYSDFFRKIFPVEGFSRISDAFLMAFLYLIRRALERRGLGEDEALALVNGVLVGEPDLESVKPVRSINAIADFVREDPSALHLLERAEVWSITRQRLALDNPDLLKALENHLREYGDRSIAELKFETKTFREDPLGLLKLIVGVARGQKVEVANADTHEVATRTEAERRLNQMFDGLSRIVANYAVSRLRLFVRSREYTRLNRARLYGVIRNIFNRVGSEWERRGIVEKSDDIFFLKFDELDRAVRQREYGHIRATVLKRTAIAKTLRPCRPVNRFWLKGEIAIHDVPQIEVLDNATDSSWKGIGCCPGKVTAEAVVLNEPSEADDVTGKIIVAESTDPGWAFLIMKAAGLVMEKGSLLSHTAIIGREMGIPTIVGVANATHVIPNGAKLSIDGTTGMINLETREPATAQQNRDIVEPRGRYVES